MEPNVQISKLGLKTSLKSEAKAQNAKSLSSMMKESSKLENIKEESYGEKSYLTEMNLPDARMNFSLMSRMFKWKMNYLNTPKYRAEMWRCEIRLKLYIHK